MGAQPVFVLLGAVTSYIMGVYLYGCSLGARLANSLLTAIFHDLYKKMLLSTQFGFAVSCDWHATRGISSRVIVRESVAHSAAEDKQAPLENGTQDVNTEGEVCERRRGGGGGGGGRKRWGGDKWGERCE